MDFRVRNDFRVKPLKHDFVRKVAFLSDFTDKTQTLQTKFYFTELKMINVTNNFETGNSPSTLF